MNVISVWASNEEKVGSYDEFVVWVHQNPGVCVRNLNVIGTTKTNYEQLDGLKNPEDTPRHAAFYLTATNVPVGTTIGMQCEPAKLEASVVTSSETETLSAAVPAVPPHFDGFVRVWAVLLRRSPHGRTMLDLIWTTAWRWLHPCRATNGASIRARCCALRRKPVQLGVSPGDGWILRHYLQVGVRGSHGVRRAVHRALPWRRGQCFCPRRVSCGTEPRPSRSI